MSDGSALICLNLRRGSEKGYVRTTIRHIQGVDEGDLVCQYPPKPDDKIQDVFPTEENSGDISFRRDESLLISVLVLVARSVLEEFACILL
jgi:hypothetical protein